MKKTKRQRDVPAIRFPGFTDSWEQRKLGEVGKARSGVGFPDTEQGGMIGVPFFKVSDMNSDGNENEMTVANNYVTAEQIAAYRWSPIEELPALFFAKVGAAVMLNRKRLCRFPFLLDNNTMAYSLSSTEWNADFAKALFETIDLTSLVQIGALPSYNAGDVEAMEISMPSLSEQGQIGEFFKQLDNLITLQERKCRVLRELKKCMLQKMFPKNGSDIPEIRFPGFTDSWEHRKFGDIFSVSQGLQIPIKDRFTEDGENRYFYITNEFLKDSCAETYYIEAPSESVICDEEDILMTRTGNTGVVVTDVNGCFHNNFFKIKYDKTEFSKRFIYYLLASPIMQKIILNSAGNSTIPDLSHKNFYKISSRFPSSKDEQNRVGEFLFHLDNLIILQERKCKVLRELKKCMLQKMFV